MGTSVTKNSADILEAIKAKPFTRSLALRQTNPAGEGTAFTVRLPV